MPQAVNTVATRQLAEGVVVPPNTFTVGAVSFTSDSRNGQGHAAVHAAVSNNTVGDLRILQAWRSTGPFVLTHKVTTALDAISGLQTGELIVPVTRRFVKVAFIPAGAGTLGADFEIGFYFEPRSDSTSEGIAGGVVAPVSAAAVPNRGSFATGQQNVTVAGTAQNMASQVIPDEFAVVIKAKNTNTGRIRIGTSAANAQNAAVAFTLGSSQDITLFITNLNLVWVDATVSGEGVEWIVET